MIGISFLISIRNTSVQNSWGWGVSIPNHLHCSLGFVSIQCPTKGVCVFSCWEGGTDLSSPHGNARGLLREDEENPHSSTRAGLIQSYYFQVLGCKFKVTEGPRNDCIKIWCKYSNSKFKKIQKSLTFEGPRLDLKEEYADSGSS